MIQGLAGDAGNFGRAGFVTSCYPLFLFLFYAIIFRVICPCHPHHVVYVQDFFQFVLFSFFCASGSAQARIIADLAVSGRSRPVALGAGEGDRIPLVNIVTPTAGGVSVNRYRRFDIQGDGRY